MGRAAAARRQSTFRARCRLRPAYLGVAGGGWHPAATPLAWACLGLCSPLAPAAGALRCVTAARPDLASPRGQARPLGEYEGCGLRRDHCTRWAVAKVAVAAAAAVPSVVDRIGRATTHSTAHRRRRAHRTRGGAPWTEPVDTNDEAASPRKVRGGLTCELRHAAAAAMLDARGATIDAKTHRCQNAIVHPGAAPGCNKSSIEFGAPNGVDSAELHAHACLGE